jgi:hypothetical protein
MSTDLAKLVRVRALRKEQAEREWQRERAVLRQAQAKSDEERGAMRAIEQKARAQQQALCEGVRQSSEALMAVQFVAGQRILARQAMLRVHRADAEVAKVRTKAQTAHDLWQQRARAHEKMKLQHETMRGEGKRVEATKTDESIAEEHLDAWIARSMAVGASRGRA